MAKLPLTKWQWSIVLGGLGIVVFILGSFVNIKEEPIPPSSQVQTFEQPISNKPMEQWGMKEYEEFYENALKELLEEIVGVGEVRVKVNLDSTEEKIYQTNIRTGTQQTNEKDNHGGNRLVDDKTRDEEVVTISLGTGEQPVIVKTLKPKIRGVAVVASGAENAHVKAWIFDVINRSLDVPANRISIVPMKKK